MTEQFTPSGGKSSRVFISFASQDRDYADKICRHLQRCGIPVWIDSTNLIPGTPDWDEAIKEAIKESGFVLYLGSPHSIRSPYVKGELTVAGNSEVKIIPVWLHGERWDECAPLPLIGMQYFDMRGKNKLPDKMDELAGLLKTAGGAPADGRQPEHKPDDRRRLRKIGLVLLLAAVVMAGIAIYKIFIEDIIFTPLVIQFEPVMDGMVRVEGGNFMMGSEDEDAYDDEKPVHQVTVSTFYIGKYEVTQQQWREVMGTDPSHFEGDDLPVERVSWNDAVEFCNRFSESAGLRPCYSGSGDAITCDFTANGYRLPTEAEWEFAARGGVKSRGYKYSGSDIVDEVAWYNANSYSSTHSVGGKKANEIGLYDMSGNVWEWCWDWRYAKYPDESQINPGGPESGDYRVVRGGSWNYDAKYCRLAYRGGSGPDDRLDDIGFRLARGPGGGE